MHSGDAGLIVQAVSVDANDDALATFDRSLSLVSAPRDLVLYEPLLDGGYRPAHGIDLGDEG